jgi:hypothetical protein
MSKKKLLTIQNLYFVREENLLSVVWTRIFGFIPNKERLCIKLKRELSRALFLERKSKRIL